MRKNSLKRWVSCFFAVLLVVCTLPVEAIDAADEGDGSNELKWEDIPEAVTLQSGAEIDKDLVYKLEMSSGIAAPSAGDEERILLFSIDLPSGLRFPAGLGLAAEEPEMIKVSDNGKTIIYENESGEHVLTKLSAAGDWELSIDKQTCRVQNTENEKKSKERSLLTGGQKQTTLVFKAALKGNTREKRTASAAVDSAGTMGAADDESDGAESDGEDSDSPSSGSDATVPVTLTLTIPAGTLNAEDDFRQGEVELNAEAGKLDAKVTTMVTRAKTSSSDQPLAGTKGAVTEDEETKAAVTKAPEIDNPEIKAGEGFTRTVFWVDNNNEARKRMTGSELGNAADDGISFTVGGNTYPLNGTTMKYIGMTSLPRAQVKEDGVNAYTLTYPDNSFPTLLEDEDGNEYDVKWNIPQPTRDGYDIVEVRADNLANYQSLEQNEKSYGWYYILKEEFSFDVVLYTGSSYNESGNFDNENLKNAVLDNFNFVVERSNHEPMYIPLNIIRQEYIDFKVHREIEAGEDPDVSPDEAEKTATVTITNGWKYNINGERMGYKVLQKANGGGTEGRIDAPTGDAEETPGVAEDDYLKITYDNSGSSYASETNATYQGGKLFLTLSGEDVYKATKVWRDQGVVDVKRPAATLELWRYRYGQDFESATPVRNSRDEIVKINMNPDEMDTIIDIEFKSDDPQFALDSLPKYDAEGYRYVYVVKEYLSGENSDKYQQVFGEITETSPGSGKFEIEDTLPDWLPLIVGTTQQRTDTNNYLYDGGTLSNCVNVNTNIEAVKTWKASSFQGEFDNVIVEMTLQSRSQTEENDGIWSAVEDEDGREIREVNYGFGEEELAAWYVNATVPKYGLLGRMLEYRWLETAVYQAPYKEGGYTEETLKAWYKDTEDKGNLLDSQGEFTLKQNRRAVKYQSTADVNPDGVQVITNGLTDTVDYFVEKRWAQDLEPHQVSFAIFRLNSGDTLSADSEVYVSFTLDKDGMLKDFVKPDGSSVTIANHDGDPWKTLIENLPQFDESGAEYQYVLMENNDSDVWVPDYETTRDYQGNYTTIVSNYPGSGQRIMVRKEWADDSDITHREPVRIEVRTMGSDSPLATVTLNESNEWSRLVGIRDGVNPDDIYIKEVSVGVDGSETDVSYDGADWGDPASVTGTYGGAHHNYEVTYNEMQYILGEHVFSVRNRRISTVDLTVNKVWKDNDGMLRRTLNRTLSKLPEESRPVLSLRLNFSAGATDDYEITRARKDGDTVSVGLAPQNILDNEGKRASSVRAVNLENATAPLEYTREYFFYNLPKYDVNGVIMHYTVEEVWLDGEGKVIEDVDSYLREKLPGYPDNYPDLEERLSEYQHSVTGRSYKVGETDDGLLSTLLTMLHLREKNTAADEQTIELTNRLRGTKTVFWHKLWDDAYAYSKGNRPDVYLDIFRMVHKGDGHGNLMQSVDLYIRDYRWDSSVNQEFTEAVLDKGNAKNHWHVVLDNLPKYESETGREYYYYAVERAKVNVKQFDYTDAVYYITNQVGDESGFSRNGEYDGDVTDQEWPDTVKPDMIKIGTARGTIGEDYLSFGYNNPAQAFAVPEEYKQETISPKHYRYPDNMLLEGGYFRNTLDKNVIIDGRKLWQALPNSWPSTDLPAVKFSVYRSLETKSEEAESGFGSGEAAEKEFVAALTVDEWADINNEGTYKFEIDHRTDRDGEPVDETGQKVTNAEDAAKLPQYDEKGRRYVYTLVEDEIIWADGRETDVLTEDLAGGAEGDERAAIFDMTQPGEKNFVATNAYNGVKGSLAVKKILKLEQKVLDAGSQAYVYPAVKFNLERYYNEYDEKGRIMGELKKDATFSQEKLLTSEEVRRVHEEQMNADPTADKNYTTSVLTFTDLEKYAPNGSEYLYKVIEDKDYLGGYDTWAAAGDQDRNQVRQDANRDKTSVGNLIVTPDREPTSDPSPAATFLNEFEQGKQIKYPLVLEKIWLDYDDGFGLRPETIKVKMYRYADPQPGQANGIRENFAELTLPVGTDDGSDFSISFEPGISGYTADSITCTPEERSVWFGSAQMNVTGWRWTLESFERYAPNGMVWRYVIDQKETGALEPEPYMMMNGSDIWGWWNINAGTAVDYQVSPMINSIYEGVPFGKKWQDESGSEIRDDYLGDLTASFSLQVQEEGADEWTAADEYFEKNLDNEVFGKIKDVYREANGDDSFERTITGKVNDKIWRGKFKALPKAVKKKGQDNIVGLTYRVVETSFRYGSVDQALTIEDQDPSQPSYDIFGSGLLEGAEFVFAGNVTTNRLDTTSLTVQKIWAGDSFNQYNTRPETRKRDFTWETIFVIQRSVGGSWEDVTEVTLYGTDSDPMKTKTIVGLPTEDRSGKAYTYRAREREPGEDRLIENSGDGYYSDTYTVTYEETATVLTATNLLKVGGDFEETYTSYAAEKKWYPQEKPAEEDDREAVFALQYLIDGPDGTKDWKTLKEVTLDGQTDEMLMKGELAGSDERMVYGEDKPWHAVWRNVPLKYQQSYIAEGAPGTTYRVVEVRHAPDNYIVREGNPVIDDVEKTYTFSYMNIEPTSLSVEKKWIGADDTEMKDVVVGLYRTADKDDIGKADDKLAVRDKYGKRLTKKLRAPGWHAEFDRIPAYDDDGNKYSYYALELSIGGKPVSESGFGAAYDYETANTTEITNSPTTSVSGTKTWLDDDNRDGGRPQELKLSLYRSEGGTGPWQEVKAEPVWTDTDENVWTYEYSDLPKVSSAGLTYKYRVTEELMPGYVQGEADAENSFVNIRSAETEFTVTKKWTYNGTDILPDITLKLYRSTGGAYDEDGEEVAADTPEPAKNGNNWIYEYKGLEKYNEKGAIYTYWVEELVPDGYDAGIDKAENNGVLENIGRGSLTISKEVVGGRGEKDREFAFRVTFDGTSAAGIEAEDVDGYYGDISFNRGTAEFALRHGESVTITDLPAGLTYKVEELDGDKDGYVTTVSGDEGIVPTDEIGVRFVNRRDNPVVPGGGSGTDDPANPLLWLILSLVFLGLTLAIVGFKRHRTGNIIHRYLLRKKA